MSSFTDFANDFFGPAAEGNRSELDAEIAQAEAERVFQEKAEYVQAQKLHATALYGSRELTVEEKQLLVKWDFATFTESTETEYGKFEIKR